MPLSAELPQFLANLLGGSDGDGYRRYGVGYFSMSDLKFHGELPSL